MIISAFPCCGKSFYSKEHNNSLDLESSAFSWMESHGTKIRNPDFPNNYVDALMSVQEKYDYIFVSSHSSVRVALKNFKIDYALVYPDNTPECYQEWKRRCYERGTKTLWDALLSSCWANLIHSCQQDNHAKKHLILLPDMYISDVLDKLY
jgi:hypothetical protein